MDVGKIEDLGKGLQGMLGGNSQTLNMVQMLQNMMAQMSDQRSKTDELSKQYMEQYVASNNALAEAIRELKASIDKLIKKYA